MLKLKVFDGSEANRYRMQRLGIALAPPIAAGLCFFAGLDLLSISLVAIAVAFPASLYSRRVLASDEIISSHERQEAPSEFIENRRNVVVYKTIEGPQIIAFYKIIRRPQDYSFHTMKASFANANLTLYPIIHANGPFLAVRFSSDQKNNRKYIALDVPEHLDAFAQTLMRRVPGLELIPASTADVESLIGVFGIKTKIPKNPIASGSADSRQPPKDEEERKAQEIRFSIENLGNLLSNSQNPSPEIKRREIKREQIPIIKVEPPQEENPPKPTNTPSKPEARILRRLSDTNEKVKIPGASSCKDADESLAPVMEFFQNVIATVDSIEDRPNTVPLTPTGKRIAGHLVLKDLQNLLEIIQKLEILKNLPINVQDKIAACHAYLELQFESLSAANSLNNPNELWARIPGVVDLIEGVLGDLLDAYENDLHQSGSGLQSA
ncbi:MAG: hypothetical protein ACFFB3_05170 [Candidatus Hodarchaeota archaeon]